MCRGEILVVDDDATVLLLLAELIRRLDFKVLAASSGEDALKMLKPSLYAVITDMHMGDGRMTGNDVAEAAKKVKDDMRVILIYSPYKTVPKIDLFSHIEEKPLFAKSLRAALA